MPVHEFTNSSNISHAHYDPQSQALTVTFKNQKTYTYKDISNDEWQSLTQAESAGSHFAKHIRPKHQAEPQQQEAT